MTPVGLLITTKMSVFPDASILPSQAHRRSPTARKRKFAASPHNDCEIHIDMNPSTNSPSSYSSSNYHTSTDQDERDHNERARSCRTTTPSNSSGEGDTRLKAVERENDLQNRVSQDGQMFLNNETILNRLEGPRHQFFHKRGRRTQSNGTPSSNDESVRTNMNSKDAVDCIETVIGNTNEDVKCVSPMDSLQRKQLTTDLPVDETAPICEAIVGRPHATFADAFAYLESMYPARVRGRPSKETLRLREVIAQHETALWNEIDIVRKNSSKELSIPIVDINEPTQDMEDSRAHEKDPLDILEDSLFFEDFAEDLWNATDPTFEPSSAEKKRSFHSTRKSRMASPRKRKLGARRDVTGSAKTKSVDKYRRPKKKQRAIANANESDINVHDLNKNDQTYEEVKQNILDSSSLSDEQRQSHIRPSRHHSDDDTPSPNLVQTDSKIAKNMRSNVRRSQNSGSENEFVRNMQEIVPETHMKTESLCNENERLRNQVTDLEAKLESECSRAQELDEALKVCIKPDEIASQAEYDRMSIRVAELEEDAEERERERTNETDRFETLLAEKQAASSTFLGRIKELEKKLWEEQNRAVKENEKGEQAVIRQQAGHIASLERIIEKKDAEILILRSESNTQKMDLITLHNTIQKLQTTTIRDTSG